MSPSGSVAVSAAPIAAPTVAVEIFDSKVGKISWLIRMSADGASSDVGDIDCYTDAVTSALAI